MTLKETIEQLEGLQEYCEDMVTSTNGEEYDSCWSIDVDALGIAIDILKQVDGFFMPAKDVS